MSRGIHEVRESLVYEIPRKVPEALRPYIFHGVRLDWSNGGQEAIGDCPFCLKEGKFYVDVSKGLWKCFVCSEGNEHGGGNIYTFLRKLWDYSDKKTNEQEIQSLAKERGLLYLETLNLWGVCKSITTGNWLVPGFNREGHLNQLYQWILDKKTAKRRLLPTPGPELGHQLHGVDLYQASKSKVFVCEGPWDAFVLWELLRCSKYESGVDGGGSLISTSNESISLLSDSNVLAVPGCNVFLAGWSKLLEDKEVYLMFDNDYPPSLAGYKGMKRVAQMLSSNSECHPKLVKYLNWSKLDSGKDGGYAASLVSGYDIRDYLSSLGGPVPIRVKRLCSLLQLVDPIPGEWIVGRTRVEVNSSGKMGMDCIECKDWKTLVNAWRKAMHWTEGLDRALSIMLAVVVSTKAVGDQLWVKIIGPASTGKTTIAEALAVARKYIYPTDTMTGLTSGYQVDRSGSENMSLALKLRDKTLVIKDGDTILSDPALRKILAQFRAFYDRSLRSQYGNRMSADHEGISTTVIICGTSSLRQLDTSELGERTLDCIIMDTIDDDLEDEVLWRVANRSERNASVEADGKIETQTDPSLVRAMQLTGGYVEYLRENSGRLMSRVDRHEPSMLTCIKLGKFIAYMRARPSTKQDETTEREFGSRIVSQLVKMAKSLTVVLNKKFPDIEVMRRITRVALDTSRGRVLDLTKSLYSVGKDGMEIRTLAHTNNQTEDKERALLRFLRRIGAVEPFKVESSIGIAISHRWRLIDKLMKLYADVIMEKRK